MPHWSELTHADFLRSMPETEVVIMQTGAVEAHGTHLPLGTDHMLPSYIADRVASQTKALVLPVIPFGDSWMLEEFSGTISVSHDTLTRYYEEVMVSVFRHGFRFIVVLNGHGGNISAIQEAAKRATLAGDRTVIIVNWWVDLAKETRARVLETPEGHAAEDETSEMLFVHPELVARERPAPAMVNPRFKIISANYRQELYPGALYGDPTRATVEKGREIVEAAIAELVTLIGQLQQGQLPLK